MTVVVMLGVQRSGTSAVAAVVEALGVPIGREFLAMPLDVCPTGCREDRQWTDVHERQGWRGALWPDVIDLDAYRGEYAKLVAERSHLTLWGVKDPRLCFTLPALLDVLAGEDVRLIVTRRDVGEVVASWVRAQWFDLTTSKAMVGHYAERLGDVIPSHLPALHVQFAAMQADPVGTAQAIADHLGVPMTAKATAAIKPGVRGHRQPG